MAVDPSRHLTSHAASLLQEARRKQQEGGDARDADAARPSSRAAGSRSRPESRAGDGGQAEEPAKQRPVLTKEQVMRRLRRLGEPATLFGETDEERQQRLHLAEQNLQVDDETAGEVVQGLLRGLIVGSAEAGRVSCNV